MRKKQNVRNKAIAYIVETHGFSFNSFGKLNKARVDKENIWANIHCNTHIIFLLLFLFLVLLLFFVYVLGVA